MIDRIKSIMDYYHLSPAQFADKIGFQRSALSHVLSGRNKASLDFVLKVKNAFPNLNLDWLTLGEGNQFINPEERPEGPNEDMLRIDFDTPAKTGKYQEISLAEEKNATEEEQAAIEAKTHTSEMSESKVNQQFKTNKAINKIILLYEDGSFSEHIPEK